jgi:hypothetical protein
MSLSSEVLFKVRLARGRKPKYKYVKGESLLTTLLRNSNKLTKVLTHSYMQETSKFPLFYLTGMNDDTTVKRELETECWFTAKCSCGECVTTYRVLTPEVRKELNTPCSKCKTTLRE